MPKKRRNEITIRSSAAEYLTYVASVGGEKSSVEMRYEDENIWLTQKMMAVLYDVSISAINQHLKRIFDDGELMENYMLQLLTMIGTLKRQGSFSKLSKIKCIMLPIDTQRRNLL